MDMFLQQRCEDTLTANWCKQGQDYKSETLHAKPWVGWITELSWKAIEKNNIDSLVFSNHLSVDNKLDWREVRGK